MVVDVDVVVDVVEVDVEVEVEVDVLLSVLVVDFTGAVAGVVVVSSDGLGGVVTDFAAFPSDALDADANATTATPAAPITQKRLAIPPFSPLHARDRRHRSDPWAPRCRH